MNIVNVICVVHNVVTPTLPPLLEGRPFPVTLQLADLSEKNTLWINDKNNGHTSLVNIDADKYRSLLLASTRSEQYSL